MRLIRIVDCFYLLLLGIGIGAIIACGVFVAPVIFKQVNEVIPNITNAESGIIMGKIFLRLNFYLQVFLVVMVVYEIISLVYNRLYCKIWTVLVFINAICIGLFVWYYTPFILDKNNLASDNFVVMHTQSVWVFKILMISMSILFVWRIYRIYKFEEHD